MKSFERTEQLVKNARVGTTKGFDTRILADANTAFMKSTEKRPAYSPVGVRVCRVIMKNRMTRFAAVAMIIIAVLVGIHQFGESTGPGGVAFAEVLGYLQTFSYTFDLTVELATEGQDSTTHAMEVMVLELGRMRIDYSLMGRMSSITDLNTGKSLILFHENKSGVIAKEPLLKTNAGIVGVYAFFSRPIENLWNLRDGTEERLGEKEIDGKTAYGFKVLQEDRFFEYEISIWADTTTGIPILVDVLAIPQDTSYPSMGWTMNNFDLDVELDEELFSLEVPEGYTMAYQSDLDEVQADTEPSAEAKKITQMLEFWSDGRGDEAIETLLEIDWAQPIIFGKEPYMFAITEQEYISLTVKDQERVSRAAMADGATLRRIVVEVVNRAQAGVIVMEYQTAERYLEATLQLGKLLTRNPDSMIIARLVGIAIKQKTLNEMIGLYTAMDDREKLQAANKDFQEAEAQKEQIKRKALGQ